MALSAQPALSSSTVPHLKPQMSAGEGFQETPSVWNKAYRRTRLFQATWWRQRLRQAMSSGKGHLSHCPCTWRDGSWWRWYHQLPPPHLDLGHSQALTPPPIRPCPIPACILPTHPPLSSFRGWGWGGVKVAFKASMESSPLQRGPLNAPTSVSIATASATPSPVHLC